MGVKSPSSANSEKEARSDSTCHSSRERTEKSDEHPGPNTRSRRGEKADGQRAEEHPPRNLGGYQSTVVMSRILIIEDELSMRTALTDLLVKEGHRVLSASDGD